MEQIPQSLEKRSAMILNPKIDNLVCLALCMDEDLIKVIYNITTLYISGLFESP